MGISDWKLKLRYGKLKTPFSHFTVLADGKVIKEMDGDSILVYDTAPEEPPRDNPYGYDIKFTPYTEE